MSVNKFGMHLEGSGDGTTLGRSRLSIESLRSYVRNNTLSLNLDYYNAKKQKIRNLAPPEIDTDATNKSYIDSALWELRDEIVTRTLSTMWADVEGLMENVTSLLTNNEKLSKKIEYIDEIRETIALNKNYVEQVLRDLRNEIKKQMRPTQKEKTRPTHNQKQKEQKSILSTNEINSK